MIYQIDRGKATVAIKRIVDEQNDDVLQEMYLKFRDSKIITQSDILKLWHGFVKLDELSIDVIEELLKFCLAVNTDSGEYQDYLVQLNTAPIKRRYFESLKNDKTRYMAKQIFEIFAEKIESVYHKDLCQLSREEALGGLSSLPNASTASLRQALTMARSYCRWCKENGEFDGAAMNSFKEIKMDDISLEPWIKKNIVKDVVDLVCRLENVVGNNHGYVAPVAAALFWMGFSIEEVVRLKNRDIDLLNHQVRNVDMPVDLITIFVQYSGFSFFKGKDICEPDYPYLKRVSAKLRGVPYKEIDIQNALKITGGLNYKNIRTAKALFDLHKIEASGAELTDKDFVSEFDLDSSVTSHLTYLKDKKRLYNSYKDIYWS